MRILLISIFLFLLIFAHLPTTANVEENLSAAEIKRRLSKYVPVLLRADTSGLPASERRALVKLIEAARIIDTLYWKQRSAHGLELRAKLMKSRTLADRDLLQYLNINYGPYDKNEDNQPFIGSKKMPAGATFYPEDMTKEEFERYIATHPEVKESFQKINTVIRREGDKLVAIPFEQIFHTELEQAAKALRDASSQTIDPALKKYLQLRADALLSGEFRESDFAWIDVRNGWLDIVIGPIEVYDDNLMGLKAAYEGTVLVRDRAASEKLKAFEQQMPELQQNLPVPADLQSKERATDTPISIVQVAYVSGASNAGVKVIAASLPNDEVVIKEKGAKKLFYKNIILAKFNKILIPIAKEMLDPKLLPLVTEEAFFNGVMGHELAHTLGLKFVRNDGKDTDTSIRIALKETYSTLEEAKADIVGLYSIGYFTKKGILTEEQERQAYASYIASTFRSIRFGSGEDHARGNIIQFNFLRERGGITYDEKTGHYGLELTKFREGVRALSELLLTIQGRGDYNAARQLFDLRGKLDDRSEAELKRLAAIPVDVVFR
ncbi:MAG: Zn-dependent hydrolase [Acidobacteriota bacterium]